VWTQLGDIFGEGFLVELTQGWVLQSSSFDALFPYLQGIWYEITDDNKGTYWMERQIVMEEPYSLKPKTNFETEMGEIARLATTDLKSAL